MYEREKLWARELCRYAGKEEAFFEDFWKRLSADEEVMTEFSYYLEHQNFLCRANVEGYTVVDIMVWQMDHFKAQMDRGKYAMKQDGDTMLLMAFDTFLKMKQDKYPYLQKLQGETGTDYPGKTF
ncbi:MAG: hypothetical protein LUH19_05090 [Lachnospiraceae bacterium]|nr:hypothetical protein [Lachnospiraceae bacterium]